MAKHPTITFILISSLSITGCRNDCQQLCAEMADFAEEQCGRTWATTDIRTCMQNNSNRATNDVRRDACADNIETLREEWTCDDIDKYFDQNTQSADTGE